MAAGYLPAPGKIVRGEEVGPCVDPCEHRDCADTRRMAEMICPHCGEQIGYEIGFYQDGTWTTLEHALCVLKKVEQERG
jgi:hypothetical protein